MNAKYLYIIEKCKRNYSAYVPDLPGCVSAGKTIKETEKMIRKAIEFHIEGMLMDGKKIPEPSDNYGFVKIHSSIKNNYKTKPNMRKKVTA